jgi:hypothetical protein
MRTDLMRCKGNGSVAFEGAVLSPVVESEVPVAVGELQDQCRSGSDGGKVGTFLRERR